MKINEKNLCVFATTPPYDLEGYLNKRGEVNKAWQKRYFVLKGNLLFYFEKQGDKEPLGLIILEGCIIELAEDSEQPYSFQIVFDGNRTYILNTNSQENMERWMKSLTCAGYEYKKLLLAELQRQLDEIEDSQKKSIQETMQPVAPKPPPRRQNPFNRPAPPPPVFAMPSTAEKSSTSVASTTTPAGETVFLNGSIAYMEAPGRSGAMPQSSQCNNTSEVGNANSSEKRTFKTVHEAFRKIVLEDINAYWRRKEDAEKPLIEL